MATYCLRADGTASTKSSATGPISDPSKCMSVAIHNAETFSSGDVVIIGDHGGVIRQQLTPPSSGVTYRADNNRPKIYPAYNWDEWESVSGSIYRHALESAPWDVFFSGEYCLAKNTVTPKTPGAGEWGYAAGYVYVRLLDSRNPGGVIEVTHSEWAVLIGSDASGIIRLSDVVLSQIKIGHTAYSSGIGGIEVHGDGCQIIDVVATLCQHGVTLFNGSVDCVCDGLVVTKNLSAGAVIAQTLTGSTNERNILRNITVVDCGNEGAGSYGIVIHGAAGTAVVNPVLENANISLLDGDTAVYGFGFKSFAGVSGLNIRNVEVDGYTRYGYAAIAVGNSGAGITDAVIAKCKTTNCYMGIHVIDSALQIIGNKILDVAPTGYGVKTEGSTVVSALAHNTVSLTAGALMCVRLDAVGASEISKAHGNIFSTVKSTRYGIRSYNASCVLGDRTQNIYHGFASGREVYLNGVAQTLAATERIIDPQVGVDGVLETLSPCVGAAGQIAEVEYSELNLDTLQTASIGADQITGRGFGPWTTFDATMPSLSLASTCPGSLLEVQEWSKPNITKKQIDKASR